jgi:hypothetical protein
VRAFAAELPRPVGRVSLRSLAAAQLTTRNRLRLDLHETHDCDGGSRHDRAFLRLALDHAPRFWGSDLALQTRASRKRLLLSIEPGVLLEDKKPLWKYSTSDSDTKPAGWPGALDSDDSPDRRAWVAFGA